jgi:hypothetical protein
MPFLSLKELERAYMRLLVYGPIGSGKTYFCGSVFDVPEMLPVLFADVDGGLKTISDKLQEHYDPRLVLELSDMADVRLLFEAMFHPKTPFKTVILDGLTELHALLMSLHLGNANRIPQIQDYGAVSDTVLKFLRRVKGNELRTHFVCTCGELYTEDAVRGTLYINPDVVGKLATRAPRYFDIVAYLHSEIKARRDGTAREIEHSAQVAPYDRIRAKDRTPGAPFGLLLQEPTLRKIYDGVYKDVRFASVEDAEGAEAEEEKQNGEKQEGENA